MALMQLSAEARELYLDAAVPVLPGPPRGVDFLRDWVTPNKPVVFAGAVQHWPALRRWKDPAYLRCAAQMCACVCVCVRVCTTKPGREVPMCQGACSLVCEPVIFVWTCFIHLRHVRTHTRAHTKVSVCLVFCVCVHVYLCVGREKVGREEVTVAVTPDGYADAVRGDRFVMPEERRMTFASFLDVLDEHAQDDANTGEEGCSAHENQPCSKTVFGSRIPPYLTAKARTTQPADDTLEVIQVFEP